MCFWFQKVQVIFSIINLISDRIVFHFLLSSESSVFRVIEVYLVGCKVHQVHCLFQTPTKKSESLLNFWNSWMNYSIYWLWKILINYFSFLFLFVTFQLTPLTNKKTDSILLFFTWCTLVLCWSRGQNDFLSHVRWYDPR